MLNGLPQWDFQFCVCVWGKCHVITNYCENVLRVQALSPKYHDGTWQCWQWTLQALYTCGEGMIWITSTFVNKLWFFCMCNIFSCAPAPGWIYLCRCLGLKESLSKEKFLWYSDDIIWWMFRLLQLIEFAGMLSQLTNLATFWFNLQLVSWRK